MPDLAARVDALGGESAENGRPVGCPGLVTFEVGVGNEFGDAGGELVNEGDGFGASVYVDIVPGMVTKNATMT